MQGFMRENLFASHACFGGRMDVKGQKKATVSCHTPNRVYTK